MNLQLIYKEANVGNFSTAPLPFLHYKLKEAIHFKYVVKIMACVFDLLAGPITHKY